MPKGETKTLATTNTTYRLHLKLKWCNFISFCNNLENIYPDKSIHLICDNSRFNKNKELAPYIKNARVIIHYLPPYSPDSNPIERLWKVMREHLTYNKVYSKFANFTTAIRKFFAEIN